jgi:hypothetical protein
MKRFSALVLALLITGAGSFHPEAKAAGGMTPEQIFQQTIDWNLVVGTWEVLPDDNPLAEKPNNGPVAGHRTMMALRKDGTCRIFSKDFPTGSDGMWYYEDHSMFVRFPNSTLVNYYVYGVKGDFMVTRSPARDGKDQLWSRVK